MDLATALAIAEFKFVHAKWCVIYIPIFWSFSKFYRLLNTVEYVALICDSSTNKRSIIFFKPKRHK